jgi:mitochondrial chaperone BCS1
MFEALRNAFGGAHQFASDGILLMIFGGLGVYLRSIPLTAFRWLIGQFTLTVTVRKEDPAFQWVKEWFLDQPFVSRIREVDVDTRLRGEVVALVPSQGRHWFWFKSRPFRVERIRNEEESNRRRKQSEWFVFTTLGREQQLLKQFIADIVEAHVRGAKQRSCLFVRADDYWEHIDAYRPRLLDSVVLRENEKKKLVHDVEKFQASRERYQQLGVPYHRGYLFYGPPGTGKTSLVSALAGKFGMSIYLLNLGEFNDKSLARAMNQVPPGSVVLFEDIDCMKAGKTRQDSAEVPQKKNAESSDVSLPDPLGVTLSGLLNVLDGFSAPENVLFVMTTNNVEMLDSALLRPGRIDYKLYFGGVTAGQKVELYKRFFPQASDVEAEWFVETHEANSMAEFQGALLVMDQQRASPAVADGAREDSLELDEKKETAGGLLSE